jgi:gamma-glutamyltranspeptidase
MLQRGGSAADAVIAASAVLAVVYPHMAGVGGDLFALVWDAQTGSLEGLNASGRAAAAATIERYRSDGFEQIPARGPLAALTVPGAVSGWAKLHGRLGRLGFDEVLAPAIAYAEDGAPVARSLAEWTIRDLDVLRENPEATVTYLPDGGAPTAGTILFQRPLAQTLRTIASGGEDEFYRGEIAERIVGSLSAQGGLLSIDDFRQHRAEWVQPIRASYRDTEIVQMPPNTQGVTALQILKIIEPKDLAALGDNSAEYVELLAEAARLAIVDRDRHLGDPTAVDLSMSELLSDERIATRRAELRKPNRQSQSGRAGGDTVYLCAVDSDGNAVSLIQSIYFDFGSGVVAGDTGVLMQNRGSSFLLEPGHPNSLAPGKRPFHTLIPAMALHGGRPFLVYGTMGGDGQPQTQAALLTRVVDFGYDVQEAIEAPRWLYGRTWGTTIRALSIENRFSPAVLASLRARGHDVRDVGPLSDTLGHAQAIRIHADHLEGGADPRGDGAAVGY